MIGNRGNHGPRPWNMTAWDHAEWRRLRDAWAQAAPASDAATFWRLVALLMGTNRSPAAVAKRAAFKGLAPRISAA